MFGAPKTSCFGYCSPLRTILNDALSHLNIFFRCPCSLLEIGVAMIFPSISAALSRFHYSALWSLVHLIANALPLIISSLIFPTDLFQKRNILRCPHITDFQVDREGKSVLVLKEKLTFWRKQVKDFLKFLFGLNELICTNEFTSVRMAYA